MPTPPPNSVEIEAKRLLRDLSRCPETAKEPLIWNALNSQRRSAIEECCKEMCKYCFGNVPINNSQPLAGYHIFQEGSYDRCKAENLRSLLEVKG